MLQRKYMQENRSIAQNCEKKIRQNCNITSSYFLLFSQKKWPLHSLPISLLLSRSLLCRLPGEADIRIFNLCRLMFSKCSCCIILFFPSSFSAFLTSKFGFDTEENEPCKVCPLSAYRSPRYSAF